MGKSEAFQKLWEGHLPDKWEPAILACFHQSKMQAKICENHPVPNPDEKAQTTQSVSIPFTIMLDMSYT